MKEKEIIAILDIDLKQLKQFRRIMGRTEKVEILIKYISDLKKQIKQHKTPKSTGK